MGRAQEIFDQDPTSGHLFLFVNRDRIKILFWDRDGFCIWYKRLERGTFQLLTTTNDEEGIELDDSQLVKLLGGLDLRTGRGGGIVASVEKLFDFLFLLTDLVFPHWKALVKQFALWITPTLYPTI